MEIIENNFQLNQAKENLKTESVIALDIETYDYSNKEPFGKIRLIQVATEKEVFVFDLHKVDFPKFLADIFKDSQVVKIMHHGIFDMSHLIKYFDCSFENTFCTAIASRILSSGLSVKNSLKASCKRFLDVDIDKEEQLSDWGCELTQAQLEYAAEDAKILLKLYEKLKNILDEKKLIHIGRMEFKIQEIASRLLGKGVKLSKERLQAERDKILQLIPASINVKEIVDSGKKSGVNAIDKAVLQLKELKIFKSGVFFPQLKIKWNRGFVVYQKNYSRKLNDFLEKQPVVYSFDNLWLPAVSVSAGDYKSRELLKDKEFFKSKESELLKAFSLKDYSVFDVIAKGRACKEKYPGISKWQDELTSMVVRKIPIRLKTGRIVHTRELGVDTVEIFKIVIEALISDFAKSLIILIEKNNGEVIQLNNKQNGFDIWFYSNSDVNEFVAKASKFVFGVSLNSLYYKTV
jgi:hypothetical protein